MNMRLAVFLLPLGLVAASTMSASAGSVTMTGTPGSNGVAGARPSPGGPGGTATAGTNTPSDPSNAATAAGGSGGVGSQGGGVRCPGLIGTCIRLPGGAGGAGGAASSQATTAVSGGSASASANSFGGTGGSGGAGPPAGNGGNGGSASASASASSSGTSSVISLGSATGGPGGSGASYGASGSAYASAGAQNLIGGAVASASAPSSEAASAIAKANQGIGNGLVEGRVVSSVTRISSATFIGAGVMDAAYGGTGQALQYEATALFNFTTSGTETFYLSGLSDNFSGIGFDNLKLVVAVVDGNSSYTDTYSYSSLASAEAVFNNGSLDLGSFVSGSQSVSLDYSLAYDQGTKATAGTGFAIDYYLVAEPTVSNLAPERADIAVHPDPAIPEASTWLMLLLGLAGFGLVGSRRALDGSRSGSSC